MHIEELETAAAATDALFAQVADDVWHLAEPRFEERATSALQRAVLADLGFAITDIPGMPTAFVAEAGAGEPVIAFLGEMDALPDLSQAAGSAERAPLIEGGCGHACGHNLLGAGSMQAAAIAKEMLARKGWSGTVRYYACPGEETGAGKAFMVRKGCFAGVDAAFCWHPQRHNECPQNSLANIHFLVTFAGTSAHASANPEQGRSALDAAELMNVGVQFLREHVPSTVRMHQSFLDAGPASPNVVPARASMLYVVRAQTLFQAREVYTRVEKVARGAALMTETEVETKIVSAYANLLATPTLTALTRAHMAEVLPLTLTAGEKAEAEKFAQMASADEHLAHALIVAAANGSDAAIEDFLMPPEMSLQQDMTSTDVGDVSWIDRITRERNRRRWRGRAKQASSPRPQIRRKSGSRTP